MLLYLALLVNLICWGFSFALLSRTLESLGRSSAPIKSWGIAISLHWVLGLASRPFELLGDLNYARAVVALSVVDAGIFIAASVLAWRAMADFERAIREHEQIRRL